MCSTSVSTWLQLRQPWTSSVQETARYDCTAKLRIFFSKWSKFHAKLHTTGYAHMQHLMYHAFPRLLKRQTAFLWFCVLLILQLCKSVFAAVPPVPSQKGRPWCFQTDLHQLTHFHQGQVLSGTTLLLLSVHINSCYHSAFITKDNHYNFSHN